MSFTCPVKDCEYRARCFTSFSNHTQKQHALKYRKSDFKFQCSECKTIFLSGKTLKDHIRNHNRSSPASRLNFQPSAGSNIPTPPREPVSFYTYPPQHVVEHLPRQEQVLSNPAIHHELQKVSSIPMIPLSSEPESLFGRDSPKLDPTSQYLIQINRNVETLTRMVKRTNERIDRLHAEFREHKKTQNIYNWALEQRDNHTM